MQDTILRLSYEGALGRRGIDLGSLVLYLTAIAQAANLGNSVHLGPESGVFGFELGHADIEFTASRKPICTLFSQGEPLSRLSHYFLVGGTGIEPVTPAV
jgi:hypothetical protein